MKTILIPTDFSSAARHAMRYTFQLFGTDHNYVILNAYEEPHTTTGSIISLRGILSETSQDGLKSELEYIRTELGLTDLNVTTVSEYGDAVRSATEYAKNKGVDLIAMGTTGASGLKEVFVGSVASSMLQSATCPVLAIPTSAEYADPKNIVLASDLRGKTTPEDLSLFMELVKEYDSKVTVLTVVPPDTDLDMARADRGFDLHGMLDDIDHEFDIEDGDDVEESILEYVQEHNANMVVSIHRDASWFSRLVNPSMSSKLAQHINVPLLTIHEPS